MMAWGPFFMPLAGDSVGLLGSFAATVAITFWIWVLCFVSFIVIGIYKHLIPAADCLYLKGCCGAKSKRVIKNCASKDVDIYIVNFIQIDNYCY